MRWFLIIIVAPIAGIYLLGEIAPPLIRMFRGSPTSATSGSFGASPEERDALLQKLAELQGQEKQVAAKVPTNNTVVHIMNGDSFGMTRAEFVTKYQDHYKQGLLLELDVREEELHYYPPATVILDDANIRAIAWNYTFLNNKLVKIRGLIDGPQVAKLTANLSKQLKSPPAVIKELKAGEIDVNDTRPQWRWEHGNLRITLTPSVRDCYDYEVIENTKP